MPPPDVIPSLPKEEDIIGCNDDQVDEMEADRDDTDFDIIKENKNEYKIMEEDEFLAKVQLATSSQIPLDLTGFQVTLTKGAIRLKGRDHLEIMGGVIQGEVHSLFQLDGKSVNRPRRLTFRNTTLIHTKVHDDPRQIGAAIFAMGASVAYLSHCDISSKGGFAIWGKHQCNITLENCNIHNVARTAVACFNQVTVTVRNTSISHVGIHGVCGRGQVNINLERVSIEDCLVRAIMIYQGASVRMEDCNINNTHDATTPTIHAQGPASESSPTLLEDAATEKTTKDGTTPIGNDNQQNQSKEQQIQVMPIPSLTMIRCKVTNSEGPPLVIEGIIKQELQDIELS